MTSFDELAGVRELTRTPAGDLQIPQRSMADRIVDWWTPRRSVVMGVLWPAMAVLLWSLAGDGVPVAPLALISFGMALSLTTYLPERGQRVVDVLGSPCATFGGVVPIACAVIVLARPGGSVLLALTLVAFGLFQRFGGAAGCGVPTRSTAERSQ